MTNKEAIQRLSQTGCATIDKLIWIAGSWEDDREIKEFLEDVDKQFYKNYMPVFVESGHLDEYMENPIEGLINFELYGLLAEVNLPKLHGFRFVGNKPVSWSVNQSHCDVERIYAESMEELIIIIEKLATKRYKKAWQSELKTQTADGK